MVRDDGRTRLISALQTAAKGVGYLAFILLFDVLDMPVKGCD
jgi:hypothetical protein